MRKVFWSVALGICIANLAACNYVVNPGTRVDSSVVSVTISPPSAQMNAGDMLTFAAKVSAGAGQTNRAVKWATGNPGIATVDDKGVVKSVAPGTAIITATSLADTTIRATAQITVGVLPLPPFISAINHDGKAADLGNISGQLEVVVGMDTLVIKPSRVDLVLNSGAMDTVVASRSVTGDAPAVAGDGRTVFLTLSFNTAVFKNGFYTLRMRTLTRTGTFVGSSTVPLTFNNPSTNTATASVTTSNR